MAASIQICLLAIIAVAYTQEVSLNFLDHELDDIHLPRHRFPIRPIRNPFDMRRHMPGIPGIFGLGPPGRFGPPHFGPPNFGPGLFGPDPPNGPLSGPPNIPLNADDRNEFKGDSNGTNPPITEGVEPVIADPVNITNIQPNVTEESPKLDKGPLKVTLLPDQETNKLIVAPVLKTNANKTTTASIGTSEAKKPKFLSIVESIKNFTNKLSPDEEENHETADPRKQSTIIFPDDVDQVKAKINEPGTDSKTDGPAVNNDVGLSKNSDAVLVPVQIVSGQVVPSQVVPSVVMPSQVPNIVVSSQIVPSQAVPSQVVSSQVVPNQLEPNRVTNINTGYTSNSNVYVPVNTQNPVSQPITNDVFPMRLENTDYGQTSNIPSQTALYTNILDAISHVGNQPAVIMPVKVYNNNQRSLLTNTAQNNQNVYQPVGVPSDIPQNPLITMLLTPANIKNVGIAPNNIQGNGQNNPQVYSTVNLQSFAQETPNNQFNNNQYYVVNGNSNANNGQPAVLNLQNANVPGTQKYMVVGQTYQNNPGNMYLTNGLTNGVIMNGNNQNSPNVYSLVPMNAVLNNNGGSYYVSNSGYQTQAPPTYSLVSMRDDDDDGKSSEKDEQ